MAHAAVGGHRPMMLSAAEIQQRYPAPHVFLHGRRPAAQYCVGGAILRAHGLAQVGFPQRRTLASALATLNPRLCGTARVVAREIMTRNDHGDFAGAWAVYDRARQVDG